MRKIVTVLLILGFLIASSTATLLLVKSEPKTIVVPDDYPTIRDAITAASAGDTIYVKNGVYNESFIIDKPLSLIGQDSQNTIITWSVGIIHQFTPPPTVQVQANDVTISGFNFKNCYGGVRIKSEINSYTSAVLNCKIIGNNFEDNPIAISAYAGLSLVPHIAVASNLIIAQNNINGNGVGISIGQSAVTISGNTIQNNNEGVFIQSAENVTVFENNISKNKDGLVLYNPGPYYIIGNTINDNSGSGIDFSYYCNRCTIASNSIANNGVGVKLENVSSYIGVDNFVINNNFVNNQFQVQTGVVTDKVIWAFKGSGNYWSDYASKYPSASATSGGTWDIPYMIDSNNTDAYPLVSPILISTPSGSQDTFAYVIYAVIVIVVLLAIINVALIWRLRRTKTQKAN